MYVLKFTSSCRELGRLRSSIELDTASVKPGEMEALEDAVNDRIRAHVPVNVRLLSIDDPDVEKVCVFSLLGKSSKCVLGLKMLQKPTRKRVFLFLVSQVWVDWINHYSVFVHR